ncbi:MAG: CHASE domain-containing protein [Fuerstiella sp.]
MASHSEYDSAASDSAVSDSAVPDSAVPESTVTEQSGGVLPWFHCAVVLTSLTVALLSWHHSRSQTRAKAVARFVGEADQLVELIIERMAKYDDALQSGVAFIEAGGGKVDYAAWDRFAASIQIEKRYPGINGIGIIRALARAKMPEFVEQRRRERPSFRIHPERTSDEYWPIVAINPLKGNEQALGLDISHETNRLIAAQKARDSGSEQITAPIVLVQDSLKTPGFLFYRPFYESDDSQADEEKTFAGLVYAPFVVRDLMEGALRRQKRLVGVRISDSYDILFDEHTDSEPDFDSRPMLKKTITVPLYGRRWEFEIWTTKSFRERVASSEPAIILAGGIVINGLLIGLLLLIARDRSRTQGRVQSMSVDVEKLELAARVNQIGIWDYDPVSGGLEWDEQMFKLYGRNRSDFVGAYEAWFDSLHPEDRDSSAALLNETLQNKSTFDCEFRVIRPDGAVRHLNAKAVVFRDSTGRAIRMLGANTDITERKNASSELEETRGMKVAILDAAGTGIITTDLDGLVVTFNGAAERMLGYAESDLVGKLTPSLFHDPDEVKERALELSEELGRPVSPGFEVFVAKAALGESEQREWVFVRKDGGVIPVLLTVTAIRDQDDSIIGYLGIASDLSERKQAKTNLEKANAQLARSNEELAQFAYVASHDLQEPLRKVVSFGELLQEDCADQITDDGLRYISYMVDGASRMRTLIKDLLDYSRIDNEDQSLTNVDCNEVVKLAIDNLYEAIVESGADIQYLDLPIVQATPRQFTQLFQNLIGNAIKYRGNRIPRVRISSVETESSWQFAVEDNGIGIEESHREGVFGIFKRLHNRTEYPGTGIGLAVCKRIVDGLGGQIWVEASKSGGSTFYFELPRPTDV